MAVDLEDAFFAVARRLAALTLLVMAVFVGLVLPLFALWEDAEVAAIVFLGIGVTLVFCAARVADARWWAARATLAIAGFVGLLILEVRETFNIGLPFVPLVVFVTAPYWPRR